MSHWYKDNKRFVPLKKDGTPMSEAYSGYNNACRRAGAVMGATDIMKQGLPTSYWLVEWFKQQALEAGIDSYLGKSREEWLVDAKDLLNERMASPADKGSDAHYCIEKFLTRGIEPDDPIQKQMVETAAEVLRGYDIKDEIEYEVQFCTNTFGGTVDVFSASSRLIFDWKTCGDNRKPYEKECVQLAAYRAALCPEARCINVYINRDTGRLHMIKEWNESELAAGLALFNNALSTIELMEKLNAK
jgi:hypothetical protein